MLSQKKARSAIVIYRVNNDVLFLVKAQLANILVMKGPPCGYLPAGLWICPNSTKSALQILWQTGDSIRNVDRCLWICG